MQANLIIPLILFAGAFGFVANSKSIGGEIRGANFDNAPDCQFPDSPAVVDIRKPPYSAKGDGISDDTDAIQHALADLMGQHRILYFPNGTYLISRTLNLLHREPFRNNRS
jgi:hypothetical protein